VQPAGVWQHTWFAGQALPALHEQATVGPVDLQASPYPQSGLVGWPPQRQRSVAASHVPPSPQRAESPLQPQRFFATLPHTKPAAAP